MSKVDEFYEEMKCWQKSKSTQGLVHENLDPSHEVKDGSF